MSEELKTLLIEIKEMLYDLSRGCTNVLIKIDNLEIEIDKAADAAWTESE